MFIYYFIQIPKNKTSNFSPPTSLKEELSKSLLFVLWFTMGEIWFYVNDVTNLKSYSFPWLNCPQEATCPFALYCNTWPFTASSRGVFTFESTRGFQAVFAEDILSRLPSHTFLGLERVFFELFLQLPSIFHSELCSLANSVVSICGDGEVVSLFSSSKAIQRMRSLK